MEGPETFNFQPPFIRYKDRYNLPIMTRFQYVEEFQEMEVRDDDVFIVTYPKSGTHWMQELVHLIYADGDGSQITPSHRMAVAEIADVAGLETVHETEPNFRLLEKFPSPRVFTTHMRRMLLPKQMWRRRCKVIYVYRHPKDVICSYYNFHLKLYERFGGIRVPDTPEQFDSFFHAMLVGDIDYGSWFDHVLEYYPHHRDRESFLFVSYEDMTQDIASVIKRVSAFLGRHIGEDTVQRIAEGTSFPTMKKTFEEEHSANLVQGRQKMHMDVYLNVGTTSQWKTRFTAAQNADFDEVFDRRMSDCKLTESYASIGSKL